MTRLALLIAVVLALGSLLISRSEAPLPERDEATPWPDGIPVYDHVVIVVEENKDYEQIIDDPLTENSKAPYINLTLRKEGANLTRMFAEEHNSQGNYFWLFSGSNQNVGFDDKVPSDHTNENYPFTAANLGAALIKSGRSFKGYSEDLPSIGARCEFGKDSAGQKSYARKHNPWVSFKYGPHDELATSSNLRFTDFPTDPCKFDTLPTVAIVVPGLKHDMHDDEPAESIPRGDTWLKEHLDPYYQWSKTHKSLLIVTWDESDNKQNDPMTGAKSQVSGLTDPSVKPTNQYTRNMQNRIPTIIGGDGVKHGDYPEGKGVTHVNVLRTLEAMYGLPRSGTQQPNAVKAGITDDHILTDVFKAELRATYQRVPSRD